ncbi:MAG: T9SS type A sorting domain-containing protein [Bacteroidales bacterium]
MTDFCKNPEAKLNFEGFDSEKMFNGNSMEIYTQSTTGERLVINTINTITQTVIPLGINGNAGKKARITAFGLETAENIYLEDRFKGKLISLSENTTYEFEFPTDHIIGRFFIRFGDINTRLTSSDVKIFESDNILNIIAQTGENIEQVEVFTVTGARVYKKDAGSNMLTTKLELTTGVYLVKVKTNLGNQNVKVNWK